MTTEEIVIDTDHISFRLAVAARRATLAFTDFRAAWEESRRIELARIRAVRAREERRQRAFNALVREEVGR